MNAPDYSPSELMVVAMARLVEDGDCLAQGIGTSLPNCAYYLAKRTHAPQCVFLYSIGGTFSGAHGPLSLTGAEALALSSPLRRSGYAELVCDHLAGLAFKEFSRPAQVDRFGNTNNVVLTTGSKELRLPGVGGIPDFSPYASHLAYLYVPRHDRATLVDRLDFHSGFGAAPAVGRPRADLPTSGPGARQLVTNLGVFAFAPEGTTALSLHPGVTPELVRERSGFEIAIDAGLPPTVPPTAEQLRLIRDEIDPLGIRDLELVPGRERTDRIRALLRAELARDSGIQAKLSGGPTR